MVARSPMEALTLANALLEPEEIAEYSAERGFLNGAAALDAVPTALWQSGVSFPRPRPASPRTSS
jgi:hypothetical protein